MPCLVFGVFQTLPAYVTSDYTVYNTEVKNGAGIVVSNKGKLKGHKGLGLLTDVFKDERQIDGLKGDAAIGHVRYGKAGSNEMKNIEPFII